MPTDRLDPNRRVVREYLRVGPEGVSVVLRQSKEVGASGWDLETGGGRTHRRPPRRTPEQIRRFSSTDYTELLLDSDRRHVAGDVTESAFRMDQFFLWTEIRSRGLAFTCEVWDGVVEEFSMAARDAIHALFKAPGDLVCCNDGYGRVVAAGSRSYTILWDEGMRERVQQDDRSIRFVLGAEETAKAEKALGG